MALNRSLTKIQRARIESAVLPEAPDRLTSRERFASWIKDLLLSRDEYPWTLFAYLSAQSISLILLISRGIDPLTNWETAGKTCFIAVILCLLVKGLDVFKKEKRLDPWCSFNILSVAWVIMLVPGTSLLGARHGFSVVTLTISFIFAVQALSAAFLRVRPKHFFVMGAATETSQAIHKFFTSPQRDLMREYYRDLAQEPSGAKHLSTIVVTRSGVEFSESVEYLKAALRSGINIVDEKEFYMELFGRSPVFGSVHDCDVIIGLHARLPFSEALMRMFDVMVALVSIIILSPLLCLISLLIKLDSKGPVLFTQTRQGQNNAPFTIYKFRTMKPSEGNGPTRFTTAKDPRVTRMGTFLRHFHLDELPQLLNVLKGQMALVGPRPEALFFAQSMREKIPAYDLRYAVRPGITGWAQLSQGYALDTLPATLEKLSYDFYYLKRRNFRFDIAILLRTAFFIWNDNSYQSSTKPS